MTRFPGAKTELYSEVIGQICLAFSIHKSQPMKMGDFNLENIEKLKKYMVFHSKVDFKNTAFVRELTEYAMMKVSGKLTFVDAQGDIQKHVANVEVYLTNPAGIGEHSNIVEAIEQELDMIAKYQDQIDIIHKYFKK